MSIEVSSGNDPRERHSPIWLRIGVFLVLYLLLHWGYQSLRASSLDPWFIHSVTVAPAAALIDWWLPADAVQAIGPRLVWPEGRLTLLAGCDGFEVISLFVAAMLASDLAPRRCMVALVAGCLAIWALNQLRIAALYGAFRYQREAFDALHTLWGPLLLIAVTALIFRWALGRSSSTPQRRPLA